MARSSMYDIRVSLCAFQVSYKVFTLMEHDYCEFNKDVQCALSNYLRYP